MLCTLDTSRDEGISIPRRQPTRSDEDSALLAKSLPMRVPALSNYRSGEEIDIDDDKVEEIINLIIYNIH